MGASRITAASWAVFFAFLTTSYGSSSHSFPTLVFTEEPSDVVVVRGQSAMLHCSAHAAVGNTKIRWKRDGEVLAFPDGAERSSVVDTMGRRLLANGTLLFSSVWHSRTQRPDEGMYQCVASNDKIGTIVSRTATLRIAALSRLDTEPADQTVFLGQTAAFECSAASSTPATASSVRWLRDGAPLRPDPRMAVMATGALTIADARISDRGEYRCNVTNDVADAAVLSRSASLKIHLDMVLAKQPTTPTFVLHPRNTKVLEGETVTLDCAANGTPAPVITWIRDGATVDLAHTDSRFHKLGAGSLQIRSVRVDDAGTFQCRAENSEDSADAAAILEVQVRPRFERKPKDTSALVKGDIELECEVFAVPQAIVQWYKNGDLIIESDYFQIVRGTNLKILGLVEHDAGVYQCVASNPVGNVQAAAQLKIVTAEDLSSSPSSPASSPSSPPSSPSGNIKQRSNAAAVPSPAASAPSIGDMVFRNTPSAPVDVSAVVVSKRFITLSWSPPTVPNGHIRAYSVFYNQEGSNRERVLNSTRGSLEEVNVQGLQPGAKYVLRVVAHNDFGAGESSQPITVSTQSDLDVPGPVSNLSARATSSFSILINWGKPAYGSSSRVTSYNLYYRLADAPDVRSLTISDDMKYHLIDLREYTEYTFWVSAFNAIGEGAFSEEVTARTMSDVPSDPPQNFTAEADSSRSLIVRWEPPPKESQNGIITGYKIRYRPTNAAKAKASAKDNSKGDVVTTDGSRRLYAITELLPGHEYQVKISAMTVNGTGPFTPWISERTFDSDLDESIVPFPPSSLRARATDHEITVVWTPPKENHVLVRGYTLGWGRGIPDEYTKVVDDKQRAFVITGLRPNSEYVISLRAYNNVGDGRIVYEQVRTREEDDEDDEDGASSPLQPPIGLHARVLSSNTALLTWIDSSLPRNQLIPDNRYYIVRYTTSSSVEIHKPKHQYRNSSDLNVMLDDLKPDTEYEFTVKVVKGRRQSRWSLVAMNRTQEAAPASAPRDLVLKPHEGRPDAVLIMWKPPKAPNGAINGYVIQYTTDKRAEDREWFVEAVVGEETSAIVNNLAIDTKYYFKMSARNSKGYGPSTPVAMYTSPKGPIGEFAVKSDDSRGQSQQPSQQEAISPVVLYAVAGVGAGIVVVVIIGAMVMVHRCGQQSAAAAAVAAVAASNANSKHNKSYLNGEMGSMREKLNPGGPGCGGAASGSMSNGPPPDLWLGHDHLELKALDETGDTTLPRSTPVGGAGNGGGPDYGRSMSSMDRSRNYVMGYSGTESEVSFSLSGSFCRNSSGRKSKRQGTPTKNLLQTQTHLLLPGAHNNKQTVKIAAINGKPRVQRYLSRESVASSIPSSGYNGSSGSTYIRSGYNLNPPASSSALSPDDLPPPGYEPSEGPPSTIEEANCWLGHGNASSVDCGSCSGGGSLLGVSVPVPVPPPQLPPTYLSSALSTSSAESSSGGSGTRSSRQSGTSNANSTSAGHMKSFSQQQKPPDIVMVGGQPKSLIRPQPTSPFRRPLLGLQPTSSNSPSSSSASSASYTGPTASRLLGPGAYEPSSCGTPLHSGQLPAIADVRSPDVLHPNDGRPCDCLSHPIPHSLSTEELHAEMRSLEGIMNDLHSLSRASHTHAHHMQQQQQQQQQQNNVNT